MNETDRPKLGIALSGAAARSVFYIGFLEVLKENNIKVDYITANSGACIVAAAFSCGTLEELKNKIFSMDKEFLFSLFEKCRDNGGLFSMDRAEQELRHYTKNYKFEDVRPFMGFTCTNINSGEEIILSMGDIARAICASSALPGIFKPIRWGNWDLVDGGLVNTVPGHAARAFGCDVVLGIDLSPRPHVFGKLEIGIKKVFDFFYWLFFIDPARRLYSSFTKMLERNDYLKYMLDMESRRKEMPTPHMFEILGKAIDIAIEHEKNHNPRGKNFSCNLLIKPELPDEPLLQRIKHIYLANANLSNSQKIYKSGRETAEKYLPKILEMLSYAQSHPKDLLTSQAKAGLL